MTLPATLDALEARAKADADSGWMEGAEQLALVRALREAVGQRTAWTTIAFKNNGAGEDELREQLWRADDAILAILSGVRGA